MIPRLKSSTWPFVATIICLFFSLSVPWLWKTKRDVQRPTMESDREESQPIEIGRAVRSENIFALEGMAHRVAYARPRVDPPESVQRVQHETSFVEYDEVQLDAPDEKHHDSFEPPPDELSFNAPRSIPTFAFAAAHERIDESTDSKDDGLSVTIDVASDDAGSGDATGPSAPAIQPHKVDAKESTADPSSEWVVPETMKRSLERLSSTATLQDWSLGISTGLDDLLAAGTLDAAEAGTALVRLRHLAHQGRYHIIQLPYGDLRTDLTRMVYSLERRLYVWESLHEVTSVVLPKPTQEGATFDVSSRVEAVKKICGDSANGNRWSRYLLLKDIEKLAALDADEFLEPRCELAARVLSRIHATHLQRVQRDFLQIDTVQTLAKSLRPWVRGTVDYPDLLARLERYESDQFAPDGEYLANVTRRLRWSPHEKVADLGSVLERHWRNANFRVALSARLMNSFFSKNRVTRNQVRDSLNGAAIRGTSRTTTRLRWSLIPDPQRIRLDLEARGIVRSETTASQGIAGTRNRGSSRFEARKPIVFDQQGLRSNDTVASAQASTTIVGLQTEYDGIPLIGDIARSMAQSRVAEQRGSAENLTERRVVEAAEQKLDTEFHTRITELRQTLNQRVMSPLTKMGLEPSPVSLQTTEQRIIARYRFAGSHQLAAHTPRPIAPTNSLLSVQVHQSALNNLVKQLELEGQTFGLEELYRYLPQKMGRELKSIPEDLPADVKLRFANHEPIRFDFLQDRVRVTLRLASLSKGRRHRWRRLTVHADYHPDPSSVEAFLARDKSIRLSGSRLDFGDQVALRGIFSRVFSRKRKYAILQQYLLEYPQLRELRISQFVVRDGWIGVAWTSPRFAERSRRVEQ